MTPGIVHPFLLSRRGFLLVRTLVHQGTGPALPNRSTGTPACSSRYGSAGAVDRTSWPSSSPAWRSPSYASSSRCRGTGRPPGVERDLAGALGMADVRMASVGPHLRSSSVLPVQHVAFGLSGHAASVLWASTRTSIIFTLSPSVCVIDETRSKSRAGSQARSRFFNGEPHQCHGYLVAEAPPRSIYLSELSHGSPALPLLHQLVLEIFRQGLPVPSER
jgi:hypothetical protein